MNPIYLITGLPGEALVRQGPERFESGRHTIPACLVGMARSRSLRVGLLPTTVTRFLPDAELQLYRLIRQTGGDAYSRYNALVRKLVSFELALDQRCKTERAGGGSAGGDGRLPRNRGRRPPSLFRESPCWNTQRKEAGVPRAFEPAATGDQSRFG